MQTLSKLPKLKTSKQQGYDLNPVSLIPEPMLLNIRLYYLSCASSFLDCGGTLVPAYFQP